MSRGNGYVPIDKNLIQELSNLGRSFTRLEAMFSYSVDQDKGKGGSINGYASQWNWSRNKTRKFLKEIRTVKGHSKDSRRMPDEQPIHFIDKILFKPQENLEGQQKDSERTVNGQAISFIDAGLRVPGDSERTVKGQQKDSLPSTRAILNPNPNPKEKEKDLKPIVEKPEIPFKEIVEYLNLKAGKHYRHTSKETQAKIRARWNEGFKNLDDYRHAIDVKCAEWLNDPKQEQFLRPETLFGTKFESYVNQRIIKNFQVSQAIPANPDDYILPERVQL